MVLHFLIFFLLYNKTKVSYYESLLKNMKFSNKYLTKIPTLPLVFELVLIEGHQSNHFKRIMSFTWIHQATKIIFFSFFFDSVTLGGVLSLLRHKRTRQWIRLLLFWWRFKIGIEIKNLGSRLKRERFILWTLSSAYWQR